MRKLYLFLLTFLLIFYLAKSETFKYQNGIEKEPRVIRNSENPILGKLKLELKEDLTIKELETDEKYMFYRVSDIGVDSRRNIYIVDRGNYRVQVFNKNGKYLKTIGRKGQGPGEFEFPVSIFIDTENNIYVKDGREIEKFDKNGDFVERIPCDYSTFDFSIPPYLGLRFVITSEQRIFIPVLQFEESGAYNCLVMLDFKGKLLKEIDKLIERNIKIKGKGGGRVFGGVLSPYAPRLVLSSLKNKIIYAKSDEYRLFVLNKEGNLIFEIQKDKKPIPVPKKAKKLKRMYIPEYCPFFTDIPTDEKGRIWVIKFKSPFDKREEWDIDIFSSKGEYLYYTKLPCYPHVIKQGCIYSLLRSKETGNIMIKRLKIKNWDEIKY